MCDCVCLVGVWLIGVCVVLGCWWNVCGWIGLCGCFFMCCCLVGLIMYVVGCVLCFCGLCMIGVCCSCLVCVNGCGV